MAKDRSVGSPDRRPIDAIREFVFGPDKQSGNNRNPERERNGGRDSYNY